MDNRDAIKKGNEEKYAQHSKKRFIQTMSTKFRTTMIGALVAFEESFGYLWGHGKDAEDLTEREKENRILWEQTRTEVLNKGNNQMRAAIEEISNYTLKWERYKTEFIIRKD